MILGVDTSIGTSLAIVDSSCVVRAAAQSPDPRGHAEAIDALLLAVLTDARVGPEAIEAVAVGMGPGPFTGLRVGIAAARAFAVARGIPVLPVSSHAAIAAEAFESGAAGRLVVVTDARRREHYWSLFDVGTEGVPVLVRGPGFTPLAALETAAAIDSDVRRLEPATVSAAALAILAIRRRAAGLETGPAQPLYLREPDVTISKGPKRVSG